MTTLTSKVPMLRSFQTRLLNVEEALSLANSGTLPEMMLRIQTSFNIYGGPTTCQTPWPEEIHFSDLTHSQGGSYWLLYYLS